MTRVKEDNLPLLPSGARWLSVLGWMAFSLSAMLSTVQGSDGNSNPTCIAPPLTVPETVATHPQQIVIAHRGASAHLPEHTLAAYRLAFELGADYIEPDLVATKDDSLVAIHSMDLNVTTDVAEKFPDRATFSPFLNRTGYWSYEFDLSEIKQLRVKQRLPEARSTQFDGMFEIPTLKEILLLLQEWNDHINPLRVNSTTVRSKRGIYAEFKDYPWLLEDTSKDLVDLVFGHMDRNVDLWENAIFKHLCDTKELKLFDYHLPPVVFQSFEGKVLQKFADKWKDVYKDKPLPPLILLVSEEKCLEDSFWFEVGDKWREIIKGLGPDKECLLVNHQINEGRDFMDDAAKFDLVVHPWTERPELDYVINDVNRIPPYFETVSDELEYLLCKMHVHGVFSESVDVAVQAINKGCPDEKKDSEKGKNDGSKEKNPPSSTSPSSDTSSNSNNLPCYETDKEAQVYVGFATFIMGIFCTIIISMFLQRRQKKRKGVRIPTIDVDHTLDDDDDENEML